MYCAMYMCVREWSSQLHVFLISALDGGDHRAPYLIHFTPRENAPSTHWILLRASLKASLEAVPETKTFSYAGSCKLDLQPIA
jgi:hypothetical protein